MLTSLTEFKNELVFRFPHYHVEIEKSARQNIYFFGFFAAELGGVEIRYISVHKPLWILRHGEFKCTAPDLDELLAKFTSHCNPLSAKPTHRALTLADRMNRTPSTVTLCGSTRFFEGYMTANRLLTQEGWVVLSVGQFGHSYHQDVTPNHADPTVKALHFYKILQSDGIVVVDAALHKGFSTTLEEQFALEHGRFIVDFTSTGPHEGCFSVRDRGMVADSPGLQDFLTCHEWQDFLKANPNGYC